MEREIKRYRIRPKDYLCITPEEALKTGISTGEQIVEEVFLVREFTLTAYMYAAIRNLPEEELKKIPVIERKEKLFESRKEAIRYIKENGENLFLLYVVKETKMFPKEEIKWDEVENSIETFLEEIKKFEKEKVKV
jgi:hypothetical protein